MNRLILVGNGFDLAHGLKTSYKDFIIWYLAKCFGNRSYQPSIYQDELLQIQFNDIHSFISVITAHKKGFYHSGYTNEDLTYFIANHFKERTVTGLLNIYDRDIPSLIISGSDSFSSSDYNRNEPFKVNILSDFLKRLIINCQDCNWVDIENEYFDQLKACRVKDGSFNQEKVKQLNSEFAYLKQKLEEYLILQEENITIKVIPKLLEAIKFDFNPSDFDSIMSYEDARLKLGYDKTIKPITTPNLYFLNFNYTDTLLSYERELAKNRGKFDKIEFNHIHGKLNHPNNPIVFGFGDEHDKQYLEFEEQPNNKIFDHIKSYQYLRTPNYRNLLRFLNSENYQVFVMGHSCGLSDRTMFKEIFEHENCKSIRLFHYNGDFHGKVINVSKHFTNKGNMRKLIVDYKATDSFPQNAEF